MNYVLSEFYLKLLKAREMPQDTPFFQVLELEKKGGGEERKPQNGGGITRSRDSLALNPPLPALLPLPFPLPILWKAFPTELAPGRRWAIVAHC